MASTHPTWPGSSPLFSDRLSPGAVVPLMTWILVGSKPGRIVIPATVAASVSSRTYSTSAVASSPFASAALACWWVVVQVAASSDPFGVRSLIGG